MSGVHTLGRADFEEVFGEMTERVAKRIAELNLQYVELSPEERDACIRDIVQKLLGSELEVVGSHRQERWEEGWAENLDAFKKGEKDALIPAYTHKDQIARWKRDFMKPTKPGFDNGVLAIITTWLFEKYLKDAATIYDFGCGTGRHLLQVREVNPKARLVGLDWTRASQEIIREMGKNAILKNAESRHFDFFKPDHSLVLAPGSFVYTIGALEQVGENHKAFVEYLLKNKPSLCVHVEPIAELLDPHHLVDYLAIEYFRKRHYLWGFLTHLRELEKEGKINIHKAQRTYLGANKFVDHYSVVVWSPR